MPQFPLTPERKRTLERIPDYEVRLETEAARVVVTHGGRALATTKAALLVSRRATATSTTCRAQM